MNIFTGNGTFLSTSYGTFTSTKFFEGFELINYVNLFGRNEGILISFPFYMCT